MKTLKQIVILMTLLLTMSCVQDTKSKTITIMVDMNGIENIDNIGIRGSILPLSWKETTLLTDDDNDGIYKTTFSLNTASYDIEFKFVKNDFIFELKNQKNRNIIFEYKPETIVYKASFDDPDFKIEKQ